MKREYSILWYRLDGSDRYLIWYLDERDGVVIDAAGRVPSFRKTGELLNYAERHNLPVDIEDASLFDLDVVAGWLKKEDVEAVDCKQLLAAWNLFDDVSRSVGGSFDADHKLTKKIYEKLFWGNNLPSVTPEGKSYHPVWTKREIKIMREVLDSGLALFRSSVSNF
jgi:hypothetical protein